MMFTYGFNYLSHSLIFIEIGDVDPTTHFFRPLECIMLPPVHIRIPRRILPAPHG